MLRIAVPVATVVATVVASVVLVAPAQAGSVTTLTGATHRAAASPAHRPTKKFVLRKSAEGAQPGLAGITITAARLNGSGKVKFAINGVMVAKDKAMNGRARFVTPSNLATGTYTVTAKFRGTRVSTTFRIYNSALALSATSFTISRAAAAVRPRLSGTVVFKDAPATGGNVDVYQNGNRAGGATSPDYLTFTPVGNGAFDFTTGFAAEILDKLNPDGSVKYVAGGTYTFQAFYTPGVGLADYIASNVITVRVTA